MLCVLFLDNTVYLLNLYVQSMGYYFQWILQIGFHSDAFEQLGPSAGAEDRGRFIPDGFVTTDGPSGWMNGWTIFYWGWWIAWCPFVGMFIAKISVGRTIKEFIAGTMAAPVIYVFMWMIIFGGAGLRMEREAAQNDLCCHNIDMGRVHNLSMAGPGSLVSLGLGTMQINEGLHLMNSDIPVGTDSQLLIIWSITFVALWAMILPDDANAEFANWKTWVGNNFTWLYIGSQDAWAVFIIIVYLSKYSSIRLGPDDSKPEYNDASWFSMLFACGVSTGLFFYGVAEPLYHYIGPNRYTADPTLPDNKLAQEAINITLYHWGLHGWVVYTIVGLLHGFLTLLLHQESPL